jgi:hypothetical protein
MDSSVSPGSIKTCKQCKTTKTPCWRRGPDSMMYVFLAILFVDVGVFYLMMVR